MAQRQLSELSWWHDALIDLLIAQPQLRAKHLAEHFSVTPGWISTVTNSDSFREAYALRRGDVESHILQGVTQKAETVALTSLDRIQEQLEDNDKLTMGQLKEAATLGLETLGYGRAATQVKVDARSQTVNVNHVEPQALADARAVMQQLGAQGGGANGDVPAVARVDPQALPPPHAPPHTTLDNSGMALAPRAETPTQDSHQGRQGSGGEV